MADEADAERQVVRGPEGQGHRGRARERGQARELAGADARRLPGVGVGVARWRGRAGGGEDQGRPLSEPAHRGSDGVGDGLRLGGVVGAEARGALDPRLDVGPQRRVFGPHPIAEVPPHLDPLEHVERGHRVRELGRPARELGGAFEVGAERGGDPLGGLARAVGDLRLGRRERRVGQQQAAWAARVVAVRSPSRISAARRMSAGSRASSPTVSKRCANGSTPAAGIAPWVGR